MSDTQKKLLVVLGMHRSGTSAITRALPVFDVHLGDRLMPAQADVNAKGFWEDLDLVEFNEKLLKLAGKTWHSLLTLNDAEIEKLCTDETTQQALDLLQTKIDHHGCFGFKDPRTAKLLPFWSHVFSAGGFKVTYLFTVRNPLSVVRSLEKRDGFPPEKSYFLWAEHVLSILNHIGNITTAMVDYDILMSQPETELRRLANELGLGIHEKELSDYCSNFLEKGLQHTEYQASDVYLDKAAPPLVLEIYQFLTDINAGKKSLSDAQTHGHLTRWNEEMRSLQLIFRLCDELSTALAEREGQINNLNQAVAEREGQINNLNQAVAEREGQINNLNQAVAEREGQISSLHLQLSQILHSRSWAITRPLRAMMRFLLYGHFDAAGNVGIAQLTLGKWASWGSVFSTRIKKITLSIARRTLHAIPISNRNKQRLRNQFFSAIRPIRQIQSKKSRGHLKNKPLPLLGELTFNGNPRDVFVFAVIDWNFRLQRPQHIARNLAKNKHRVFYISNHFIDATEPGYTFVPLPGADNLYQVKLHVIGAPAIYFAPPSDQILSMLQLSMALLIQDFSAVSSISIVQHAFWYPLAKQLPNSYRVYDCMDHHEGFGDVPKQLITIEKEMLSAADLITVTSSWLENFARRYNPNVMVVRNAADYKHFETRPEQVYTDDKGRQIIGYFGAIAEWFDLDTVRNVALTHCNCLILLIGNDTIEARKKLADIPNVQFTGEVPYAKLPYYLHSFTVCLLPFKVIPLTLATNPVKVYEYLAAGKPVVCVDLPEIDQFGDQVRRASSINEFVSQVGRALQESGVEAEHKATERRSFAAGQTWDHRAKELITAIDAVNMPRVSVIILTFNNLDLTRACLNSVLNRTDYPNLEIIVVDNASSDETPSYLADFAAHHPDVRVVLNKENLGFAAGNNIGLSIATGDYLVVLNNDTVVTPGWILTMLRHFQASPSLGLLNPVTNNIGNEARINISYPYISHMPDEALTYTLTHMGQRYPMRNAAFFCVMMPRSTYERCGLISEDYGRGFFEDDDYCRKVEAAGLSIACAEDVFIHHHLSASFNKLKDEERQALFERNKTIYEQKWGKWIPHVYRP